MGVEKGARGYLDPAPSQELRLGADNWTERRMTTDPEEGRRQIEAMKPTPLKVGDKVRLLAGRTIMTVVGLEEHGNNAVCGWYQPALLDDSPWKRETFPVSSLVLVEG